jgi:hypothetical protein
VRYKIAGTVEGHDYSIPPGYGQVEIPSLKEVEPFLLPKAKNEDDEKEKKE